MLGGIIATRRARCHQSVPTLAPSRTSRAQGRTEKPLAACWFSADPSVTALRCVNARGVCWLFAGLSRAAQAMRVHSIDYGAFLRAQAAPPPDAAVLHHFDERRELPVEALPSAVVGNAEQQISVADEVAPVKVDADKPQRKNDGSGAEKKQKAGAAGASAKGAPQKRNK